MALEVRELLEAGIPMCGKHLAVRVDVDALALGLLYIHNIHIHLPATRRTTTLDSPSSSFRSCMSWPVTRMLFPGTGVRETSVGTGAPNVLLCASDNICITLKLISPSFSA